MRHFIFNFQLSFSFWILFDLYSTESFFEGVKLYQVEEDFENVAWTHFVHIQLFNICKIFILTLVLYIIHFSSTVSENKINSNSKVITVLMSWCSYISEVILFNELELNIYLTLTYQDRQAGIQEESLELFIYSQHVIKRR